MDKKVYDFTKKASRTAYEEAVKQGVGEHTHDGSNTIGDITPHKHPDYALKHELGHQHFDYALMDHKHDDLGGGESAPVVILTQEEFDALENKSESTLYVVMDND
jgi:hypothetical protein